MVGTAVNGSAMDLIEKVEPLPEELNRAEIPPNGAEKGGAKSREIVLGRNVHTMCFAIKEPEANDEVTGEREAYMASVLARYRKSLVKRTKHHLGTTVKGAVDDLDMVIETLAKTGYEDQFYIHCDGALFGLMMPFAKRAPKVSFKAYRKCECVRAQVCGVPYAMWCANNKIGTYQCPFKQCGIPCF